MAGQHLGLKQIQQQALSPQQIQLIKLLQVTTAELAMRVEQELEINPALEEGPEVNDLEDSNEFDDDSLRDESSDDADGDGENDDYDKYDEADSISLDDYLRDSDISGYKLQGDGPDPNEDDKELPIESSTTFFDKLIAQLGYLPLTEKQEIIGKQLIGSIDNDGYIRRDLESISNDLAFSQNLDVTVEEIEEVLFMIQKFDPPGIAARNLQECLINQLDRRTDNYELAALSIQILEECFDEFTRKHYDKIQRKLGIEDYEQLKEAINLITKLNPKPGEISTNDGQAAYIIPDFIVYSDNGKLEVVLNSKNAPELRVSSSYNQMLQNLSRKTKKNKMERETLGFIKQKIDAAKWFIDAIKQRQITLLKTMNSIVQHQKEFFLTGDESRLKPMILKDIADDIEMDISTVSRVTSTKYVQTEFGTYLLKYFFSEGITSDTGEEISSREVKSILKDLIEHEDKRKPLSDDKLEEMLRQKGYNIARRTVAKYREQLGIPLARLRKQL
jgi:RNA polymerase sigma-54 factor